MDNPDPLTPAPRARFGGLSRRAAVVVTSSGLLAGGLAGGFLIARAATTDATTSPASTPSSSSGSSSSNAATTPAPGTFRPNEDPTHEAGESAAREAQENAGQRPTVP
jgi:hypothetical protein